jgi:hypothetical protein
MIFHTAGGSLCDPIPVVQLPQQESTSIRANPPAIKSRRDLFAEKASKTKLLMAHCIHKGILAKDLFINRRNTLADALPFLKT